MKNPFSSQDGSIPHEEAIDWMDLFHIEEKTRQPQLIARFTETRDHLDQLLERLLRQVVEVINNGIQDIPGRIDKGNREFG